MHIRFIYPGFERHSVSNPEILDIVETSSYLGTPSLSIAMLAALTPEQHQIEFLDDRIDELPQDRPDLVAIPVFTPAATRALEIARMYRELGAKVVVGGIFPSLMPEEMASSVDAICIGEGEPVWPQIVADAQAGKLKPRYQASEPYDLTQARLPRYDLYFEKEGPGGYPFLDFPLQISRGCPLACVACAIPHYMGKKMRFYPPEFVAENFRALNQPAPQRRGVCLTEDISSLPTSRISEHYCASLQESLQIGPRVAYIGTSPMQALKARPEFFGLLRQLDAIRIYLVFGFDSVSRGAFSTPPNPKMYQASLDAVKRVFDEGLDPYCSLLVGHDEEDPSVFDRVLEFAHKAGILSAEFVILTPYPGTPLWHKYNDEGRILHHHWHKYNDANVTFQPKQMSPEQLRQGYIYLWHEFYRDHNSDWPVQV